MPDYGALVKVMKQAGNEANNAACPVNICFGKVINTSPLQVLVDQKMTLGAAQLVLTRNVTDYEVEVTVDWETKTSLNTHNHDVSGSMGNGGEDSHNHTLSLTTDDVNLKHSHVLNGKKTITIHNSLVKGDEVVLLRQRGGQKYIIIDRVGEL